MGWDSQYYGDGEWKQWHNRRWQRRGARPADPRIPLRDFLMAFPQLDKLTGKGNANNKGKGKGMGKGKGEQEASTWFCHRCGTSHTNGSLTKCRSPTCNAPRLRAPTAADAANPEDELPGVPKAIREMYQKHMAEASKKDGDVDMTEAKPAAAVVHPVPPKPEMPPAAKQEQLEKAKQILVSLGLESVADVATKDFQASQQADKDTSLKAKLDAAARFAQAAQRETEQAEKKLEKLKEDVAKAEKTAAELRQRAAIASACHREALDAYKGSIPQAEGASQAEPAKQDSDCDLTKCVADTLRETVEKLFTAARGADAGPLDAAALSKFDWQGVATAHAAALQDTLAKNNASEERPHKKAAIGSSALI